MASTHMTISIEKMPEVLDGMRNELARMLREVADDEAPAVARRLIEIAAAFQAGVATWPDSET